jgi:hypothetical protein
MINGSDETYPFSSDEVDLQVVPPTPEQRIWLVMRVFNGYESGTSVATRFNFSNGALRQSVCNLRKNKLLTGKRGRPPVIDIVGARSAQRYIDFTEEAHDNNIVDVVVAAEFETTLTRRKPEIFVQLLEQGSVPKMSRRSLVRYRNRLKAGNFPA